MALIMMITDPSECHADEAASIDTLFKEPEVEPKP
jgi:hypothetical protein